MVFYHNWAKLPWDTGEEPRLYIKFLFATYIKHTVIYSYNKDRWKILDARVS